MRVGVFHGNATDANPGGKAVFAREMAASLAAHHDVVLYTARHGGDAPGDGVTGGNGRLDGVDVVRFPRLDDRLGSRGGVVGGLDGRLLRSVVERAVPLPTDRTLALAGAVRAGVPAHVDRAVDVLLTHRVAEDLVLSNLVDVPVVYQYHNVASVGPAARLRERLTGADAHLANSRTVAAEVAAKLGREVDGVVTPGVDTSTFVPDADPALGDLDGVRPGEDVVLFVGRVVPGKGVDDLLAALARLDREVRAVVVGPGDLDRLTATARQFGVADSVTAVGPVPHDELPGYYAGATVVCNPTRYEGFGMVNLEAMACGAPLVTTRLPGVEAYATNDRDAILVDPGDVDALAGSIGVLLDDPERRDRLAAAAVETAREYAWDAQAERLAEFCAGVVEARASASGPAP